ncbi:rhodanese-like domain-containing protein [Acidihalobacter prosperus]
MNTTLSEIIANARKHIKDISADKLNDKIDSGDDFLIIDVREPYEYELAHIPNAFLIDVISS